MGETTIRAAGSMAVGLESHARLAPPFVCVTATAVSLNVTSLELRDSRLRLNGVELAPVNALMDAAAQRMDAVLRKTLGKALNEASAELLTPAVVNPLLPTC